MLSTICKKIIKPFPPTPSTKRWHKLSLADQSLTKFYIPVVLFYPKEQVATIPNGPKQLSKQLVNSLSKTLTSYYPWAGSLKDNATINCDDTGAEFLEVHISSPMDKVANHPNSHVKDLTFPKGVPWGNGVDRTLTVAQLSHFDCGGVALSICLSHKVGDGSSTYCFLRDWAALTRSSNTKPSPYFVEDTIIPSPPEGPLLSPVVYGSDEEDCNIQKRFIFSSSKLNALKSLVASESGEKNITSNEVVNALLYKCAAFAASASSRSFKRSQLVQLYDMREIVSPPLPPNSIGNLVKRYSTPIYQNEEELMLPKLVTDIRKSKNKLFSKDNVKENERVAELLNLYRTGENTSHKRNCDVYTSSNVCKFGYQDLDFGFGKPIRTSIGSGPRSKHFFLMRTCDRGIEACVNLNEEDMSVFQQDKHLLEFATPTGQDGSYDKKLFA